MVKETVSLCTGISFSELALTICELLNWKSDNGRLKIDSAKVALKQLEKSGEITLPKGVRKLNVRRKSGLMITERSSPKRPIKCDISELGQLKYCLVEKSEDKTLWSEFLDRYHYLGIKQKFGDTLQYFVKDQYGRFLGCIEFSPSSMAIDKRDRWIGWTKEQKNERLKYVINNSRFLILPWVKVKNLASKILSESVKRAQEQWELQFHYKPVLVESFVDSTTYVGGCYIAANWQYMGLTKGRGRNDKNNTAALTEKKIFVMPIQADFRKVLAGEKRKQKKGPRYSVKKTERSPDHLLVLWEQIIDSVRITTDQFDKKWQKRRRVIDSFLLTMLILRLVMAKSGQSYATTIGALWDDHKALGIDLPQERPISASSFTTARVKLDPDIFKVINERTVSLYEESQEDEEKWFGKRLFAVDGTKLNLPRPLLHEGYELPMKEAYYPQGIVSCLYQLKNRVPYDFCMSKKKDERESALAHLKILSTGDAVIYDRGYYSYAMLSYHRKRGVDAIFRLSRSLGSQIDGFWENPNAFDEIVSIYPGQSTRSRISRQFPDLDLVPLKMRLVKYKVEASEYVIGTTIFDKSVTARNFSDAYHGRWGIEELYKTTKTMLNAEHIRAKSEQGVLQEIYANFAITTFCRVFTNGADSEIKRNTELKHSGSTVEVKVNFQNALLSVQRKICGMFSASTTILKESVDSIFQNISRVYQATRPGRSFPRTSMRPTKRMNQA